MLKTIDVTLRDGGYRNNFHFSEDQIIKLITYLTDANIDYIEIGYYKGSLKPQSYHGLTSQVSFDLIAKIKSIIPLVKIVVMAHPRNIDFEDLLRLKEAKLDLLRLCLKNSDLQYGLNTVRKAKEIGLFVSANLVRITEIPLLILSQNARSASDAGADIVYLADSNGSLIPQQTAEIFKQIVKNVSCNVGFHAHNNLSLALANTIVAMENGASYIDGSICGMGKGAGNLRLDMFLGYLTKIKYLHNYDFRSILKSSEAMAKSIEFCNNTFPIQDILTGVFDLSLDVKLSIDSNSQNENLNWYDCAFDFLNSKKCSLAEIEYG